MKPYRIYFPVHVNLQEHVKVSFSLSNKQEPLLRHPVIRQPWRKDQKTDYINDSFLL